MKEVLDSNYTKMNEIDQNSENNKITKKLLNDPAFTVSADPFFCNSLCNCLFGCCFLLCS